MCPNRLIPAIARAEGHDPGEAVGVPVDFTEDRQLSKQEIKALAAKKAREKMKNTRCRNPVTASAGRFERLAAFIVDRIITICVMLFCYKVASVLYAEVDLAVVAAEAAPIPWHFLAVGLGGPVIYVIGTWIAISFYGRTIGKYMLGIKIVDGSGYAPGFFQGVVLRQSIAALNAITPVLPLLALLQWLPEWITVDSKTTFDLAKLYIGTLAVFDICSHRL